MTLSKVRSEFVNQSGRLDLVNEDGSNNGADFYINAGQKYLDRLIESGQGSSIIYRYVKPLEYLITFNYCRVIEHISISNLSSFYWLNKLEMTELKDIYQKPFEIVAPGRPQYFSLASVEMNHEGDDLYNGMSIRMNTISDWPEYNGVVIMPPADQEYHLEIWGKFYSKTLVNDDDENFWTAQFSYILVMAAQRSLEVFYRNSQGAKDWTAAIQSELFEIEKDFVEETYFGYNQMEG